MLQVTSIIVRGYCAIKALVLSLPRKDQMANSGLYSDVPYRVSKNLATSMLIYSPKGSPLIKLTPMALFWVLNLTVAISHLSPHQYTPPTLNPIRILSSSVMVRSWDSIKSYTDCLLSPLVTAQAVSQGKQTAKLELEFTDLPPHPISNNEQIIEKINCFISKSFSAQN